LKNWGWQLRTATISKRNSEGEAHDNSGWSGTPDNFSNLEDLPHGEHFFWGRVVRWRSTKGN